MKKKLLACFSSLAVAVLLIVSLCGCSTFSNIKKAYEKAGYKETDDLQAYQAQLTEALGEDESAVVVHALVREPSGGFSGLTDTAFVVIIEFKSTDSMIELMKEHPELKADVKESYDELQKSDRISGTCLLFLAVGTDAYSIFASTK